MRSIKTRWHIIPLFKNSGLALFSDFLSPT